MNVNSAIEKAKRFATIRAPTYSCRRRKCHALEIGSRARQERKHSTVPSLTNATRVALFFATEIQVVFPLATHYRIPHLLTAHREHQLPIDLSSKSHEARQRHTTNTILPDRFSNRIARPGKLGRSTLSPDNEASVIDASSSTND